MSAQKDLKKQLRPVVILCAGEGHRLMELGKSIPKALVKINERPIISHVINYWKDFASQFIFIVGYKKEQIISFVESERLSARVSFVEQQRPLGIAHAVNCAEEYIKDNFIVVLGDCVCKGHFIFPDSFVQGAGVWETANAEHIKKSYSIEIENNLIGHVVEKPKEIKNSLCGMGFYFFEKRVFKYIGQTPPSALRNEIEITDVIQKMIDGGEEIAPLFFKGEYINIGSKEDVLTASALFKV